jgi:hypothetical protein
MTESSRWRDAYALAAVPDANDVSAMFQHIVNMCYRQEILPSRLQLHTMTLQALVKYGRPLATATYSPAPYLTTPALSTGMLALDRPKPDRNGDIVIPALCISTPDTGVPSDLPVKEIIKAQTHRDPEKRQQAAAQALEALDSKDESPLLILRAYLLSNNLARLRSQPLGELAQGLKEADHPEGEIRTLEDERKLLRRLKQHAPLSTWALRVQAFDEPDTRTPTYILRHSKPSHNAPALPLPERPADEALHDAQAKYLDDARFATRSVMEAIDMLSSITVPACTIPELMQQGRLDPYANESGL